MNKPLGWNGYNYTRSEKIQITKAYRSAMRKNGWLEELSIKLGRPKANISRYARSRGLTNRARRRTYPHPRGMLGKTHSAEYRAELSARMKIRWQDPNDYLNSNKHRQATSDRMSKLMVKRLKASSNNLYSNAQKGWAEFSGGKRYYLKSGWELRYANYLEMLKKGNGIVEWEYEPDTFWFEKIRRGVRSYTPDFKIFLDDGTFEYHEVKGWMDSRSKTKLKRMGIYYPEISLTVIDADIMKRL